MIAVRPVFLVLSVAALVAGCAGFGIERKPRYVVTIDPVDLGIGSGRFCVAVDLRDPHGVWWWEPGKDCSTRRTGPDVFHAENASVTSSRGEQPADVRFRIPLKRHPSSTEPPFADIVLRLENGFASVPATASRTATGVRADLAIREEWR